MKDWIIHVELENDKATVDGVSVDREKMKKRINEEPFPEVVYKGRDIRQTDQSSFVDVSVQDD